MLRVDDLGFLGQHSEKAAIEQVKVTPGASVTTEWAILHKDGRWCRSETRVTNMLDDPSVQGLVFNTRDISDRKALEQELSHPYDFIPESSAFEIEVEEEIECAA